jgi:hypothetical protein
MIISQTDYSDANEIKIALWNTITTTGWPIKSHTAGKSHVSMVPGITDREASMLLRL